MKKMFAVGVFATAAALSAQDIPYRIFVATFAQNGNQDRVNKVMETIGHKISQDSRLNVGSYDLNGRKFVYVDTTPVSTDEAKELLAKVKDAGYKDAFMKSKSVQSENKSSNGTEAKIDIEQAISKENGYSQQPKSDDNALSLNNVIKSVLNENPSLKAVEYNYLQVGKDLKMAKTLIIRR
ncbi:MAG: hypothetical protein LUC34_05075 [Campylobacter sp.]|nr:hypothetical protein [Campylobacter sp.]